MTLKLKILQNPEMVVGVVQVEVDLVGVEVGVRLLQVVVEALQRMVAGVLLQEVVVVLLQEVVERLL